jgi:hypothetical protein
MLGSLISSFQKNTIQPTATLDLIAQAKKHLAQGIILNGQPLSVLVFVPDDPKTHRSFFYLQQTWPGGKLKEIWAV